MALNISKTLALPPEVHTQASAILGIRGSGKTHTAVVDVEEMLERSLPVVVIDPLDVWWGLKSSKDGNKPGFPIVIAGGSHADVPLDERSGATLADFVVENPVPVILSLRHLTKGKQRHFVTDFAEQLFHRKGESKYRTPLLVVIDEAPTFVPQYMGAAEAKMVGAIEDIVCKGRASGLGVMLISQRAATINKNVLTQVELIVAHRMTSPQDRKALKEWIDANADTEHQEVFLKTLASLKKGEAWFWSPLLNLFQKTQVRDRKTFDSSATPTSGAKPKGPKTLASVDLDAVREKLKASIEQAKENDPAELRKKIQELGRVIRENSGKVERVEVPVLAPSQIEALQRIASNLRETIDVMVAAIAKIRPQPVGPKTGGNITPPANSIQKPPKIIHEKPVSITPRESPLNKCERAILATLSQHGSCDIKRLSLLSGYKRSGSFMNCLSAVRTAGFIAGSNTGMMAITDAGEDQGPFDSLPTGADLQDYWLNSPHFNKCERSILAALINAHPDGLSIDELAEAAGYNKSGSFMNCLSKLRTSLVLVGTNAGEMRAADHLFN